MFSGDNCPIYGGECIEYRAINGFDTHNSFVMNAAADIAE